LGWARAELLAEQLKGRDDLTPLQTRLLLLVLAKQRQIRAAEVQIFAIGLASSENHKDLELAVDRYHKLLFPGTETAASQADSFVEQAKKALAEETKKAYIVRPVMGENSREALQKRTRSENPLVARWAQRELMEETQAEGRLRERLKNKHKKAPRP
jgi:hypothetical protein